MKRTYILILFLIVAAIQLAVPAQMIWQREAVLNQGTLYKFKTRPIDPADPFRGKYITLDFEADRYNTKDSSWVKDETIYVYLDVDSLGFAKVAEVRKTISPDMDKDYIEAKAGWYHSYSKELTIQFSFNRFYMEESKAYPAEVAVRENQRNAKLHDVYALVYIKDGMSVLKDVMVGNMPIKDYVMLTVE